MKNKRKTMVMAMFASMALLILSGFANAASISGYTAFKDGIRNTLNLRNGTVALHSYLTVDGVDPGNTDIIRFLPPEFIYHFIEADLDNGVIHEKDRWGERYIISNANNDIIYAYNSNSEWYGVDIKRGKDAYFAKNSLNYIFDTQPEIIRIVELLADALSGTSKDYFFVSDENGAKTVTAKLNKEQIPEIVGLVTNLAYTYDRNYSQYIPRPGFTPAEALEEKIDCGFIKQIDITGINITAVMDSSGNFTDAKAEIIMLFTDNNNDTNEMVTTVIFTATDIGNTTVVIPDELMEEILSQ